MDDADAAVVLARAELRATALAEADSAGLVALLHPDFRWTTHVGEVLDRARYVASNTTGRTVWHAQTLLDPEVVVVGETAVLRCTVVDAVGAHEVETFRMPLTQVWVRLDGEWVCLAGHAGPRLTDG
jgi:ketosteroid isomerase-like protein